MIDCDCLCDTCDGDEMDSVVGSTVEVVVTTALVEVAVVVAVVA